ncbi:hypothetical protein EVAR_18856_1 [Eumeta japonica]|uniref:Uncharacterized protein n=1 Tax=Eumeta variegata TaxID=151549 RepID=A0A4C1UM35_EUMVA|nr:hypothetical protein EVAR_18856_1 [Eumeta japonica]
MLIIRSTSRQRARSRPHSAGSQTETHEPYYSKSRIVMSGPAEVGVIYGHGIPGTYIKRELASYKRSRAMGTNGKENFGVTRTISINLKNIIDNDAEPARAGTSLGGRREIKKKARSRTRLRAEENGRPPLITLHTAAADFPDNYYFVAREDTPGK